MRGFQPAVKSKAAKPFTNGGPVRGPGTGTSDDIADEVPNGTYIMPADSTQAVGEQQLAAMGTSARGFSPAKAPSQGDGVPVQLSNGEFKLPPEQVHAVGVQALDQVKNATHTPSTARGFAPGVLGAPQNPEPPLFFADGGLVDDEKRRANSFGDSAAAVSTPGTTQVGAPAPRPAGLPAPSTAPSPSNTFPGNRLQGDNGASGAPVTSPTTSPPAAAATASAAPPAVSPQAQADRAAIGSAWDTVKDVSNDAGRAIADVATLVPRGLVGAYDSAVVRPMRAAGLDAAYLSPKLVPDGVDPESMTPFTDQKRMQQAAAAKPPVPGQQPLPAGVSPSSAGAGRGSVNPPLANPNAVPTAVGLPGFVPPAPPEAAQVMQGVYRNGNSYGDSPASANAGAQTRGLPSPRNMAAADALAQRSEQESIARISAGQSARGFAPGAQAGWSGVIGPEGPNSRERSDLMSALTTVVPGARGLTAAQRNGVQALMNQESQAQQAAERNATALAQTRMQNESSAGIAAMREAGDTGRAVMRENGETGRANARNSIEQGRLNLDTQVRGFDIRAGERQEKLQQQYAAAKTPQEREAVAKHIRDLAGKPEQSPWRVQVTPSVKNVDGSTSEGSVIRYNDQTGAVEKVDLSGGNLPPAKDNPAAMAIVNDTSLTLDQRRDALKKMGYT